MRRSFFLFSLLLFLVDATFAQQLIFRVDSALIDNAPTISEKQNYTALAYTASCEFEISAFIENFSLQPRNDVKMVIDIYHDSTSFGNPGFGLVGRFYTDSINLAAFSSREVSKRFPISNFQQGYYRACLAVESTNTTISASITDTLHYQITDTLIARDLNNFSSAYGPSNWHSPKDGDAIGLIIAIDSSGVGSFVASSVNFYLMNDTGLLGLEVSPRIWGYSQGAVTTNPVAASPFNYQITPADLGNWVTLSLFPPISLAAGAYLVGIEQMSGEASGKGISLGSSIGQFQNTRSNGNSMVYLNDSAQARWALRFQIPGIRLGMNALAGCNYIGLDEEYLEPSSILLYPNPTNGLVSIQTKQLFDLVEVRDLNGKLVHRQDWNNNDQSVDLSFLENGLYFLRLRGEEERVEKLVIQK